MNLIAQFPVLPMDDLSKAVLAFAIALVMANQGVSIFVALRRGKDDVMPKSQLVETLATHAGDIKRLEADIEKMRVEQRDDTRRIFERIETLSKSIATALTDVSRSLGRLEGVHETAKAITDAIHQVTRQP